MSTVPGLGLEVSKSGASSSFGAAAPASSAPLGVGATPSSLSSAAPSSASSASGPVTIGVSHVTRAAWLEVEGLVLTGYAQSATPDSEVQFHPGVEEIRFEELLDCCRPLLAMSDGVTQANVEEVMSRARVACGGNITSAYQRLLSLFIWHLRRPEDELSSDDKLMGLSMVCAFVNDRAHLLRGYEDLCLVLNSWRVVSPYLRSALLHWGRMDKEEILLKAFKAGGSRHEIHLLNAARQQIGPEWGLSQDPGRLADPYMGTLGGQYSPEQQRALLESSYTAAVLLQNTYDRLSDKHHRHLFSGALQRLDQQDLLPEGWEETFYEEDCTTPSMHGVAFVLQQMGFLKEAKNVSSDHSSEAEEGI